MNQISFLTHELKNPLAICQGYLEMYAKSSTKKKEEYIDIIKNEIKRTLTIIEDYSELSKIENLSKEPLDLVLLYDEIKEELTPLFKENQGEIIILDSKEIYIEGDYTKLKQLFYNLLKNALEAKDRNKLLVIIKTLEYENKYCITITDNGVGMTQEELSHVEEEYYTTKINGTGLGVPLMKEIVKKHGWELSYQSKKGVGTKVEIIIPKEKSPKTFNNNSNYY